MKSRIIIELGDLGQDEKPLTKAEMAKSKRNVMNSLKHIDYPTVIADLTEKAKNAKGKDKADYLSVIEVAKRQQKMMKGF